MSTTAATMEDLKKLFEQAQAQNQAAPCPSCGHCPTCGRGGYYTRPYWPQPFPAPMYPWPTIMWTSNDTSPFVTNESMDLRAVRGGQ